MMTPEENLRMERLEELVLGLLQAPTIDRSIQTALEERLKFLPVIGTGSAGSTVPTGGPVPANPSGTVKVVVNGVTYELLYK